MLQLLESIHLFWSRKSTEQYIVIASSSNDDILAIVQENGIGKVSASLMSGFNREFPISTRLITAICCIRYLLTGYGHPAPRCFFDVVA